jgi:PAS domain S-box-containing protein
MYILEDRDKTKEQLISELAELRGQVAQPDMSEARYRRMEDALKKDADAAWKYLSVAEVILLAIDGQQKVSLINNKGCAILGYTDQEIIGKNWFDKFIPEGIRDKVKAAFSDLMLGNLDLVEYFENKIVRKDGQERIIAWHNALLKDDSGNIVGTLSSGEDITCRKQAEKELAKSQRRDRQFREGIRDGFATVSMDGKIIETNTAFQEMLGYTHEELCTLTYRDFTPIKWHAFESNILAGQVIPRGYSEVYEKEYIRKDGSVFPVELRTYLIKDEDGKPSEMWAFVRDVSERTKRQNELFRLDKTRRALSNSSHAMMHAAGESEYLDKVCKIVIEDCGHSMIWIGFTEEDEAKTVRPVASAGFEEGYLETVNVTWADTERGRGPTGMAIRNGSPSIIRNTLTDPSFTPWRKEAARRGYASVIGLPLTNSGQTLGAMTIYSREVDPFSEDEVKLLAQLANDLAFGVTTLRLREHHTQSEKALRASEEQFRKMFEGSPIGMVMVGADFRFVRANAAFCEMLGYTEKELASLTFKDITHPEHIAEDSLRVSDLLNGRIPLYRTEKRYVRKDKRVLWGSTTVNIMRDGDDRFLYFFTTVEDITDHKQAEEALRQSKEQLQALINAAPVAISLLDAEGNRTYINRKCHELFGYTLEDIPTMGAFQRLAFPDPAYRDTLFSLFPARGEDREVDPYEATVTCKDGSQRHVIVFGTIVSDMMLVMLDDVTERKRLEAELQQAQKMEAVGHLAGGVAHDFNNILTAIIGFGTLIEMGLDGDSPHRPYIGEILRAAERAARLTDSLLAYSRKQIIQPVPLNLNDSIEYQQKLLGRLVGEDIRFNTKLSKEPLVVMADPGQVDQIVMNIVTNARDAMPKGGTITIGTMLTEMDDGFIASHGYGTPGAYALITISDTGTGIDEGTLQKIFNPFFTTKEVGKGTGLGLSVVYGIVKQNNGYIDVESQPDKGTTFFIYLPVVALKLSSEKQGTPEFTGGDETVLVCEDEEAVRSLTRTVLERAGYTVLEAPDGNAALRIFQENLKIIDLVILDVVMPGMNGKEVYDNIKRIKPEQKVLFNSGYTDDIVATKGILEDKLAFISKPLKPVDFLKKVRSTLES